MSRSVKAGECPLRSWWSRSYAYPSRSLFLCAFVPPDVHADKLEAEGTIYWTNASTNTKASDEIYPLGGARYLRTKEGDGGSTKCLPLLQDKRFQPVVGCPAKPRVAGSKEMCWHLDSKVALLDTIRRHCRYGSGITTPAECDGADKMSKPQSRRSPDNSRGAHRSSRFCNGIDSGHSLTVEKSPLHSLTIAVA